MENVEFQIKTSFFNGGLLGKDGQYSFSSLKEAVQVAEEFKNNPRSHNNKMPDDDVEYWKKQKFIIIRKITISEEFLTI